jgi:hypothetical protein
MSHLRYIAASCLLTLFSSISFAQVSPLEAKRQQEAAAQRAAAQNRGNHITKSKSRNPNDPCKHKVNDRIAYSECVSNNLANSFDNLAKRGLVTEKDAKEARNFMNMMNALGKAGVIKQGVPRTDLGPADNSTSETVYDRIDKIAKEDERNRQARMLREAAMPLKGYLGISPQAMSPGMAMAYKMDATVGEWIKDLQPGGPAEKAGLIPGDVIYMVNDQKIDPAAGVRLVDVISNMAAGSSVKLGIFRRDVGPLSYEVVLEGRR